MKWELLRLGWALFFPSPPSLLQNLQFPLQITYPKNTCAEMDVGIFGVKPAQVRSKHECKKPHYTTD